MTKIRKLLICTQPKNEVERDLQRMYLNRIQEMFKKAISMESAFNVFDEVFHGLAKTSLISEDLYSFYESFLTITQYYQHSQAGRGSLVAKLLKELGTSEKMEFEFVLKKLPRFLGESVELKETALTKQKFDIINKNKDNLAFCELKMKVYSGCSAGRIELMEKFNKFVKLINENKQFRDIIKKSNIKNVYLIGGVLFDIEGAPATTQKDKEWGICYNGLVRARDDIIKTLKERNIKYNLNEEKTLEKAFIIEFTVDGINVRIIAVYGNEVIKSLFIGQQKYDIGHFKKQLEGMLYDDLWLGQIIALSERSILERNLRERKKIDNYILTILTNKDLLTEIIKFDPQKIGEIVSRIMERIETLNKSLLEIKPIPAELIIKSSGEDYSLEAYIGDIVQFLSCSNVLKEIKKEIEKIHPNLIKN